MATPALKPDEMTGKLQSSLLILNLFAMVLCSVALMTMGSEARPALSLFVLECFFSILALSVMMLSCERLLELVLSCSGKAFIAYLASRAYLFSMYFNVRKMVDKEGNSLFTAPSRMYECEAAKDNKEQLPATEIVPFSANSSTSETPTFVETSKASPSSMSDDSCSAATTAAVF